MIYQHYKGGLYHVKGFAHSFTEQLAPDGAEFVATATMIHGDELIEADVIAIRERQTNFHCLLIYCEQAEGVYVFYQGVDGRTWLRPKEEFFEEAREGVKRFQPLDEQAVFDLLRQAKTG